MLAESDLVPGRRSKCVDWATRRPACPHTDLLGLTDNPLRRLRILFPDDGPPSGPD